ncbi:hypothetical protein CZ794_00955 [Psychrobacter sp. JB385]|nr:hypothetical protein CZ794_00955 [Psychrobacter sp. JB385]
MRKMLRLNPYNGIIYADFIKDFDNILNQQTAAKKTAYLY